MTSREPASRVAVASSRWVVRFEPRPRARIRLFCFPYAGSGASVYRAWPEGLPHDVEVCAVQMPGREGRYGEPLVTDVRALVPPLCAGIAAFLDRPVAFFGHSLGALVAYETALALGRDLSLSPTALFVSAHRAPHLPRERPPIHHLPEPAFLDELRRLNGTPAEVFAEAALLEVVLPPLRADFQMAETYAGSSSGRLSCPVVALGGIGDDRVSRAMLDAWREVTTGPFEAATFPGDHFFITSHRAMVLDLLRARLARFLG